MYKWLPILLLIPACSYVNRGRQVDALVNATSFTKPLVTSKPLPVTIMDWEKFVWSDDDPSAVSFNLYYSFTSPHVYDNVITGLTNLTGEVSNMVPGVTYYLAATVVDANGVESNFSDQYVFIMPTTLEFGFTFYQPVTNVSVQSSTDLINWRPSNARPRPNGLWRVDVDPNYPVEFYRGIGQ